MAETRKHAEFSAEDYRRMAARFGFMLADPDNLSVCSWELDEDGEDGNHIPSLVERTVVAMLLKAAEMKEREDNQ